MFEGMDDKYAKYEKTVNIFLKKPDSNGIYHAHILKGDAESTASGWKRAEAFKVLDNYENTGISNLEIIGIDYRDKGGRAFQVLADIKHENQKYRIRFDMRDYNLFDILTFCGCDDGFKLKGTYCFMYDGTKRFLCKEDNNYGPYIKGMESYNETIRKNELRKSSRINKRSIKVGKIYKNLDGIDEVYLGDVLTLEYLYKSETFKEVKYSLTVDELNKNYKLNKKLNFVEEINDKEYSEEEVLELFNNARNERLDSFLYTELSHFGGYLNDMLLTDYSIIDLVEGKLSVSESSYKITDFVVNYKKYKTTNNLSDLEIKNIQDAYNRFNYFIRTFKESLFFINSDEIKELNLDLCLNMINSMLSKKKLEFIFSSFLEINKIDNSVSERIVKKSFHIVDLEVYNSVYTEEKIMDYINKSFGYLRIRDNISFENKIIRFKMFNNEIIEGMEEMNNYVERYIF